MFKQILFLFLIFPLCVTAGHRVEGVFQPAKDFDFVILYKVTPERLVYVVNGKVDKKTGGVSLELKENAEPGVYRLVYELPEEENNFTFIYNGKEDIKFNFSTSNGVSFSGGQNSVLDTYLKSMELVRLEIFTAIKSGDSDSKLRELIARQKSIQQKAETDADAFTAPFIKALRPYIPDDFQNKGAYTIYRKSNFFDNFDFNAPTLQASRFPLEMLKKYYYEFVTLNDGNNYREAIHDIARQIKKADKHFQKLLLTEFWQFLYDEKRSNAANFLATHYLISLAKENNDQSLANNLERIVNTSVGSQAPDFELRNYNGANKLSDLNEAEFYLLIFWSTECSHCMSQIPEVYEELNDIPNTKLQVVAVALEIEDTVWKQKAREFRKFINVLALDTWRDEIVKMYDVQATPTFFVLDRNKEIVSRPRGKNNLMTVVDAIRKYEP